MAKVQILTKENLKKIDLSEFDEKLRSWLTGSYITQLSNLYSGLNLPDGKHGLFIYEPHKILIIGYFVRDNEEEGYTKIIRVCPKNYNEPSKTLGLFSLKEVDHYVISPSYISDDKENKTDDATRKYVSTTVRTLVKKCFPYVHPDMTLKDYYEIDELLFCGSFIRV